MRRWGAGPNDALARHEVAALVALILLLGAALAARGAERAPMPQPAGPIGFGDVVGAALADARALGAAEAADTRYLSAAHLPPADRRELYAVLSVHVNLMSRESELVAPRKVTEWLWAVRLSDYRWPPKVWEDLRRINTYFALKVQTPAAAVAPAKKTRPKLVGHDRAGNPVYSGTEEYTDPGSATAAARDEFVLAPWLPLKEAGALALLTGSATPVVRADQFLYETGAQANRAGHGYYDFLALKSRKDAEQLAALDRRTAEGRFRELAAVIKSSGVSPNNRQVFWYRTVGGSWWETRDAFASTGKKNALNNLLDDYAHDAEEIVFTLPNRLPGYYLSDAQGNQVDSAPDTIASDGRATNNDRRVHPPYSCVACHEDGGLKPMNDYMRRVNRPERGASFAAIAADPDRAKRLKSVYLGPLQEEYEADAKSYGRFAGELSGLKSAEFARAYQRRWTAYIDAPVTPEVAAAECGVTADQFRAAVRRYAARKVVSPVLADLAIADPEPARREHWEEFFPVAMLALGGLEP